MVHLLARPRVAGRLLRVLWQIARGFWIIRLQFSRLESPQRQQHVQRWARQMLRALGIELSHQGPPVAGGPVLLVANHISWLDILVLHAAGYCRFISKADVRRWPLIGYMAHEAGTLFIERQSRRDAHRMVHFMAERLRAGDVLAVFPEGTTGDGLLLRPFHANLIEAAILADVPVQPVALRFVDTRSGQISHAPRFVDDDTLVGSVLRTLAARGVQAQVLIGQPEHHGGRDRRQWAQDLRHQVMRLRGE
jgi:1-acyl-sn-glycerol-3-phosphate acyltransferase